MINTFLKVACFALSLVLLYAAFTFWRADGDLYELLETTPAKQVYLYGTITNVAAIAVVLVLYFIVPDDRRILYGAFTTLSALFVFLTGSQAIGLFNSDITVTYLELKLVAKPHDTDTTVAQVITGCLMVLCARELRKTNPAA